MASTGRADLHRSLNQQILEIRERYPDLYAFLVSRESQITRLLNAVPSPADIERSATFDAIRHLQLMQRQIQPAVPALLNHPVAAPRVARGHLRLLEFESLADGKSASSAEEAD